MWLRKHSCGLMLCILLFTLFSSVSIYGVEYEGQEYGEMLLAEEYSDATKDGFYVNVSIGDYLIKDNLSIELKDASGNVLDTQVTEITKSDFVALFNQLKKIYVSSTLKKTKTSAGLIFDYAIEKGSISVNPAKSMGKLPKSEIISDDAIDPEKALTSDEVQYIRECAECSETMDGMLLLLLYTGMRPGELRALYKTDIDVERGVVRILYVLIC